MTDTDTTISAAAEGEILQQANALREQILQVKGTPLAEQLQEKRVSLYRQLPPPPMGVTVTADAHVTRPLDSPAESGRAAQTPQPSGEPASLDEVAQRFDVPCDLLEQLVARAERSDPNVTPEESERVLRARWGDGYPDAQAAAVFVFEQLPPQHQQVLERVGWDPEVRVLLGEFLFPLIVTTPAGRKAWRSWRVDGAQRR